MVQPLQLGEAELARDRQEIPRLNRLPIFVGIGFVLLFLAVVITGLSWRGFSFNRDRELGGRTEAPATSFGERLKQGVTDGIIGEPDQRESFQPTPNPVLLDPGPSTNDQPVPRQDQANPRPVVETEDAWQARLEREQREQYLREAHRQQMARLQAEATAFDSPIKVDVKVDPPGGLATIGPESGSAVTDTAAGLLAAALRSGSIADGVDPNAQTGKAKFFNQDIKELGYLPNGVLPPRSRYELKRGSVIPATLITGLNSDLPGRITAQVSQNVYDSATGHRLLIPQGAKLFGRYDSGVAFGQQRALVIWTDLVFPNGATLQIHGMAGTDGEGYGGFKDTVDRHLLRTFGSAALVAIIGAGIDMSMPDGGTQVGQDDASDAVRRNFAESFGRVAEQTISKGLNVQPTIRIRPGYNFNVMVDQDIVFPGAYNGS